ncbi:hypothetical protein AA313_de0205950 [Arthrobotrys entomopaga]|nr:hypothetical protein AA313_de0205950 [Arthrobotrys entomopaga]
MRKGTKRVRASRQEGPVQSFFSFLRGAFGTRTRTPSSSIPSPQPHETKANAPVLKPILIANISNTIQVQSGASTVVGTPAATEPNIPSSGMAWAGGSLSSDRISRFPCSSEVDAELAALSVSGLQNFRNRGVKPLPNNLEDVNIPLLPTEIIDLIFFHFWDTRNTDFDIQNFRLACKLFNEVAVVRIYRDLRLRLNEDETEPWERLVREKQTGLKYTTALAITAFPRFPEHSRYAHDKPAKYSQSSRDISRAAIKGLLEALEPGQLQSFSFMGRHIIKRIPKLDTKLLFDKQPNLRHLCIPLPMLLRLGDNIDDVLRIIPRFESLYLTDVKYIRHISDIWALLQNSADTLTSLAIRSPNLDGWWGRNELERYLRWDRNFFGSRVGLPRTDLHLRKLRDLFIEGIPNLDRFINDCAPYLIPWATLRMLRIERCYYIEGFLLLYCNARRMPKLKSFQLVDEFESTTFDEMITQLAPLETLMVCSNRWQARPNWWLIKSHHGKSLKRLWMQNRYTSSASSPGLFDTRHQKHPYTDCFFPTGWPVLEEAAIELSDAQYTVLPESVKVCRLIGNLTRGLLDRYYWDTRTIMNKVAKFGVPKDQGSNLMLTSVGTHDPPDFGGMVRQPHYFAVERTDITCPGEKPKAQVIEIRDVKKVFPGCHIMWFERNDRPWSDSNGSLWY